MNENDVIEMVGDADVVATLKAANNGLPVEGEGEATHEEAEGFFIPEDDTATVVH